MAVYKLREEVSSKPTKHPHREACVLSALLEDAAQLSHHLCGVLLFNSLSVQTYQKISTDTNDLGDII